MRGNGVDISNYIGGYLSTVGYIPLHMNLKNTSECHPKKKIGCWKQKGMKSRGRKIRDADLEFNKSCKGELRKKHKAKQNIHCTPCQDTFSSNPTERGREDYLARETTEEAWGGLQYPLVPSALQIPRGKSTTRQWRQLDNEDKKVSKTEPGDAQAVKCLCLEMWATYLLRGRLAWWTK